MLERTTYLLRHLLTPPYTYMAAAALVLLVILYAIHRYRRAHRPIVPFRAEGGDIEIAPQTIRGLINSAAGRTPGVEWANCRYEQKGRKLRLRVSIHLQATSQLVEVQDEMKKRIRRALQSHIGMEPRDIDPIRIKVTKIVGNAEPYVEPAPEPAERRLERLQAYAPDEDQTVIEDDRPDRG